MRSLTLPQGRGHGGFQSWPRRGSETALCARTEFFPFMNSKKINQADIGQVRARAAGWR